MLLLTCVAKNILSDVLSESWCSVLPMFLCTLGTGPVLRSGIEVAGFDVLKPLYANGVDEKEGLLTHTMTLVEELTVCMTLE